MYSTASKNIVDETRMFPLLPTQLVHSMSSSYLDEADTVDLARLYPISIGILAKVVWFVCDDSPCTCCLA